MAKSLSCADVGATDCSWSASADTEVELMVKVKEHHGHDEIPAELAAKIQSAIKDQ